VLVSITLTVFQAYLFEFFGLIRNFGLFNSNLLLLSLIKETKGDFEKIINK
jgi:hypothetical protein